MLIFFFFFQAEDGIRDYKVTGVPDVCSSDLGRPVEGNIGPIDDLADAHLSHKVPKALFGENHGVDKELLLEVLARMFLVGAVRIVPDVARYIRTAEVGRQIAPSMRAADFHAGKTVERSVENHAREEDGGFQRIPDNVA